RLRIAEEKLQVRAESHTLTEEQSQAAASITEAVRKRSSKVFLLFGVTSSGKTEVYLKAIREAVEFQGRTALLLVPEISLCKPFYDILSSRLEGKVGIWH